MRHFILSSFLLCVVLIQASLPSLHAQTTCKNVDQTQLSFCAGLVSYQISSDLVESTQDRLASVQSARENVCPFYTYQPFTCRKYFPRCQANQTNPQTFFSQKICTQSCLDGKYSNNNQCQYYSDAFFKQECSETSYFSDGQPCDDAPAASSGSSDVIWWKIVIALVVVLVGLVIGASLCRQWCRSRMTPEQLDAEDAAKARKQAARNHAFVPGIGPSGDRYLDLSAPTNTNLDIPTATSTIPNHTAPRTNHREFDIQAETTDHISTPSKQQGVYNQSFEIEEKMSKEDGYKLGKTKVQF